MHPVADGVAVPVGPGRHRRSRGRSGPGLGAGAHRLDAVALHARRDDEPRHGRPDPREAARAPRGVGPGTLAAVVAVALVAGVGAGAAVDRWGVPSIGTGGLDGSGGLPGEGRSATVAGVESPDRGGPVTPSSTPDPAARHPAEPEPTADPLPEGVTAADVAAGIRTAEVPAEGGGELVVVPGAEPAPVADVPVRAVRVEVERDLGVDGAVFAAMVMATLNDPRGWGAGGTVTFARTDGDADLHVVLVTPATVDVLCAPLTTQSTYSCGIDGRAILNAARWWHATDEYVGLVGEADLTVYRQYLVNHEVGHLLGEGHVTCPAEGALAPVMQQQTVGVAPCLPNAWPFPDAT